jgi:putative lipoprotein
MKRSAGILLAVVAALTFAGCCNCGKISSRTGSLTGSPWQLVQIDGRTFAAAAESYTLNFAADNNVSGKGDCNRLSGTYASDREKGTLSFGPLVATRMMCPDQASENAFIKALDTIDSYKIDGRMLVLFADGEQKMMLEKRD